MAQVLPIAAVTFSEAQQGGDISRWIAPPYDVLDEGPKRALLATEPRNIVAIDLPVTPPKTVGPDAAYEAAGATYRQWLEQGVLVRQKQPAVFVYQQSYTHRGRSYARRGVIANVKVQEFAERKASSGAQSGGIFRHEKTFAGGTEDRLKLMRATRAQLSPIFGIYDDPRPEAVLQKIVSSGPATFRGRTAGDGVLHEVWRVPPGPTLFNLLEVLSGVDLFIADGHHRYTTAINYRREQPKALACMFVLVSMRDPGMIVLPTHRVLGGLKDFSIPKLTERSQGVLRVTPFQGSLEQIEAALPGAGPHAMGLVTRQGLALAATARTDPLASSHAEHAQPWRELDVAIVQHLLVEQLLEPGFCAAGAKVSWKFPHELSELERLVHSGAYELGVVVQPTPLDSVRAVSEAGELMPQKSTFFYPKLATGLVINPLD